MLRQSSTILPIRADRPGLTEFTKNVRSFVVESGIQEGLLTIFCRHTSASLVIQENAAPAAKRDLEAYFERIAPEGAPYEHDDEGTRRYARASSQRAHRDSIVDPGAI